LLIYAIRHGQTDWNVEGRLQGAQDVPLNDHGREQARGNGRRLLQELGGRVAAFDFVASPLGRTRETMALVRTELGLDPDGYRTDNRLIEVCFGDWEGHTLAEIDDVKPGAVAAREADKWHFQPSGATAESYEILSWRVSAWLSDVARPTVCVCHGGVIRSLFKLVGGLSPDDAAMAPAYQDRIALISDGAIGWLPTERWVS
jgi:broad specificity phosphatase PhoE